MVGLRQWGLTFHPPPPPDPDRIISLSRTSMTIRGLVDCVHVGYPYIQ